MNKLRIDTKKEITIEDEIIEHAAMRKMLPWIFEARKAKQKAEAAPDPQEA